MNNDLNSDVVEECCGGTVPANVDACCVADANAKASGDDGCECSTVANQPEIPAVKSSNQDGGEIAIICRFPFTKNEIQKW